METLFASPDIFQLNTREDLCIAELIASAERYRKSRSDEIVQANYDLLEPLASDNRIDTDPPALTVCIPLAITREEPETITRTLDVLAASRQQFGKPIDVVLWANAKYANDSDGPQCNETANQRYAELRSLLVARGDQGLRVQTALQVLPQDEATMSQLRANYMDAVAEHAVRTGLGYDHPVLWMDADTTAMSPTGLEKIEDAVRHFDGLFVHPISKYSIEWAAGIPVDEIDVATKIVAIDEIQRRQMAREELKASRLPGYVEEPGLAFALGTYMDVGGVDVSEPISEATRVINQAVFREIFAESQYLHTHGTSDIPVTHSIVPEFLTQDRTEPTKSVYYLTGASMTTSARRIYTEVNEGGIAGLGSGFQPATTYRLFSDIEASGSDVLPNAEIVARQMRSHVARREARDITTAMQMRLAQRLIDRYL